MGRPESPLTARGRSDGQGQWPRAAPPRLAARAANDCLHSEANPSKCGAVERRTQALSMKTRAVGLAVATALLLTGSQAAADEPVPPPAYDLDEYPPPATRWSLVGFGLGGTAVWYGGAVGLSYLWPSSPGAHALRYPVAGPWLALSKTGCPDNNPGCEWYWLALQATLTAIDGVGQVGSLAVAAEALWLPTRATAPASAASRRDQGAPLPKSPGVAWMAAPMVSHDMAGLGLFGRF